MKNFIELHNEWIESGRMPNSGLCICLSGKMKTQLFDLFKPTEEELLHLVWDGFSSGYWASGVPLDADSDTRYNVYTELRQNIMLLLAAMNGEL